MFTRHLSILALLFSLNAVSAIDTHKFEVLVNVFEASDEVLHYDLIGGMNLFGSCSGKDNIAYPAILAARSLNYRNGMVDRKLMVLWLEGQNVDQNSVTPESINQSWGPYQYQGLATAYQKDKKTLMSRGQVDRNTSFTTEVRLGSDNMFVAKVIIAERGKPFSTYYCSFRENLFNY